MVDQDVYDFYFVLVQQLDRLPRGDKPRSKAGRPLIHLDQIVNALQEGDINDTSINRALKRANVVREQADRTSVLRLPLSRPELHKAA